MPCPPLQARNAQVKAPPSGANADAVNFHNDELASEEVGSRLLIQESGEVGDQLRNDFRMIVQLKGDDTKVIVGRIRHNVQKVAVQRKEQGLQFLSFGDNKPIRRADVQMFPQKQYFVSLLA